MRGGGHCADAALCAGADASPAHGSAGGWRERERVRAGAMVEKEEASGGGGGISEEEAAQYDRQIRLWGLEAQKR